MARADIDAILENINTRLASDYIEAFGDFLVATVLRNPVQLRAARLRLEDVVRESMGSAEVLGALSTLRVAARPLAAGLPANLRADRMALVAFSGEDARRILTRVTFTEALDDFVDRAPVVVQRAAERTAATIARLYREGDVVAFAKSAEDAVTQRAQDLIGQAMREGIPERQIGRTIAFDVNRIRSESAAWTESYARMAFRTNLNDAVSQGRLRMAQDADVKAVVPAMRFTAVGDHDTRRQPRRQRTA